MKTRRIDLRLAVLGSISRQSKQSGRLTKPLLDDVKRDLKQRYGEEFSDTWLLEKISELEDMGLVRRARGILRNGRETVYTTKRGEEVALTLIKLSDEEAFVHNGWEGTVYGPLGEASVERKTIESDEKRLKEMKRNYERLRKEARNGKREWEFTTPKQEAENPLEEFEFARHPRGGFILVRKPIRTLLKERPIRKRLESRRTIFLNEPIATMFDDADIAEH